LKTDLGKTVVLATHSIDAAQFADRQLMMRDGRLHGEGEIEY
jgi:ABC-type lipoprotein export system ATPase subunit